MAESTRERVQEGKRFDVVSDEQDADVIVTLMRGRGTSVLVPIGGVVVGAENEAFRLTITDRGTKAVVWDDHLEAAWTIGGAVSDLSKRLHEQLRTASR